MMIIRITIKFIFANFNILEDFLVLSAEGRIATQHDIEDNSAWPNIAFFIVISLKDFRGNVVGRTKPFG